MEKNKGMFAELEKVLTELVSGKEQIPQSRIIQIDYSMEDTIKEMEGMKEKIKSYIPKVKVDINPPEKNIVSDVANELSDMVAKQRDGLIKKQLKKMTNDTIQNIQKQVGINYEEVKKDFDLLQEIYTKEHLDNWLIDFRKRTKKSDDVQIDLSDKLREIKKDIINIDVISKPEYLEQEVYEMTQEQVDFYNEVSPMSKEQEVDGLSIVVRVKDGEPINLRPGEYVISTTPSNKKGYSDYLIGRKGKVSWGSPVQIGTTGKKTKEEPKIIIDNFYHDVYYFHNFYIEINKEFFKVTFDNANLNNSRFFKVTFDNANLNNSRFCNILISKRGSGGYHYDEMFKISHNDFYPEGTYPMCKLDPKEVESKNREKLKEIITMLEGLSIL